MQDIFEMILEAIRRAAAILGESSNESDFQASLTAVLGSCERELRASFDPASLPRLRPPQSVINELADRKLRQPLPQEGIDPCVDRAKLDILWRSPIGAIPIELKYCSQWKSDTNGYQFLKDLHRLERMNAAGNHTKLPDRRYAAFVTREQVYWHGTRPEPRPFWLTQGRRIEPGYLVQYDQPSAMTQWYNYPPFFLANAYEFNWHDLHADWKCLLVEVLPQPDLAEISLASL